ncbi:MAG: hypothetical protein OXE99_06940 [Cellvibrionales bacterium]|nr:hypothetical protein [Cellvibrionales bacterium]
MTFNKTLLAFSITAFMLAACGGSDNNGGGGQDLTGCPDVDTTKKVLKGDLNCDLTIEGEWNLEGVVNVGNGGKKLANTNEVADVKDNGYTLTIKPGTHIKADNDGTLIVTRGSKLMAEGTKEAPITFSSKDDNFDGTGEWGGVVIQGFAPQNAAGTNQLCSGTEENPIICNVKGEGGDDVAFFGGTDPADNSGSLKYVRITEGGKVAAANNEINGLTLQGVGHGTQLSYIQVHGNLDDGIEWFGGTANATKVVLTNNDDDDLDFDEGYQGHIQHALIIKNQNKDYPSGSNDPRAIEANSSDDEAVKATDAKLANITIIGSDMVRTDNDFDPQLTGEAKDLRKQPGMRLRGDLTVEISNSVVVDYHDCLRVDHGQDEMTTVTFNNVITGSCEDDTIVYKATEATKMSDGSATTGAIPTSTNNNLTHLDDGDVEPMLNAALAMSNANASFTATDIAELDDRTEFTFENTGYAGAIDPAIDDAKDAWWYGWTIPGSTDIK